MRRSDGKMSFEGQGHNHQYRAAHPNMGKRVHNTSQKFELNCKKNDDIMKLLNQSPASFDTFRSKLFSYIQGGRKIR